MVPVKGKKDPVKKKIEIEVVWNKLDIFLSARIFVCLSINFINFKITR